jgi:hypothetical protein
MDAFPDVGRFAVDSMQCQYRRDYNTKKMYVIIISIYFMCKLYLGVKIIKFK